MKKDCKIEDFFLLSLKKTWIVIVVGFISIILHNLISGLMKTEEAFFFIVVVFVIPVYFIICFIYSLWKKFKQFKSSKEEK